MLRRSIKLYLWRRTMKSFHAALMIALSALALPAPAHAFCFMFGEELCSAACDGKVEKITPELVQSSSPNEKVCAIALSADPQTLNQLIKSGLDINTRTTESYRNSPSGRNALFRVINSNSTDLFMALLEKHIEVNVQDRIGRSPLMIAAWGSDELYVDELLKAGALPNLKDNLGKTALCFAQDQLFGQNEHVITALKKAGGTCE